MPSDRDAPVAGVVLAAGNSSRMGSNKLLIDLGSETVVRRATRQALEAGLTPVIVVMGFEADRVARALEGLDVRAVVNGDHEQGINTSVQLGIAAVPKECAAAVVILADMPFVTDRMIGALTKTYRQGTAPLVISMYDDVQAPPTLYDRSLFGDFVGPAGEGCGRHIVRKHRHEADLMTWSRAALADLDIPDDVERLLEMSGE